MGLTCIVLAEQPWSSSLLEGEYVINEQTWRRAERRKTPRDRAGIKRGTLTWRRGGETKGKRGLGEELGVIGTGNNYY